MQRGCTFRREADIGQVLTLKDSNPDFLVETPDRIRFLLELKSVGEQDTLLDRIDPSVTVFSIDSMLLQNWRRGLDDGAFFCSARISAD